MEFCEQYNCTACCLAASVPLLSEDVNRIILLGHYDAYFVNEQDGVKVMSTRDDGSCVFYKKDTGSCEIYEVRPLQCRFRPYTICEGSQEPGIDSECKYSSECKEEPEMLKKMREYFETLKKEVEFRRRTGYF